MQTIMKHVIATLATITLLVSMPATAELPVSTQKSIAPMLSKVMPAVVNISVKGKIPVIQPDSKNESDSQAEKQPPRFSNRSFSSYGSGVIIDAKQGFIVTNAHVVKYAETITVTLSTGHEHPAKLIGSDPASDVALIKVDTDNLYAISFYDSDKLVVGDFVAAIGSPFGLKQTVTSGIVSGLQRSDLRIETYEEFIQTDASINPGNSGGALVDMDGHLVGINTAIMSPAGGNVGIGFAIPSNMAKSIIDQLIKYGRVQRGLVGVHVQQLDPKLAKVLGSPREKAAVVSQVSPHSPAALAGIKEGDVVLQVNDTIITNATQIRNTIGLLRVGSKIKLKVARNGKNMQFTMTSVDPNDYAKKTRINDARLFGVNLNNFNQQLPNRGHVEGVALMAVAEDSPAWKAGLRAGDVIMAINHQATLKIEDVEAHMLASGSADLLVRVLRGTSALYVVFE